MRLSGVQRATGLGVVVGFLLVASSAGGPATAAPCSSLGDYSGACIGNGSVDIGGSMGRPGSGGTPGSNIGPGGEYAVCGTSRTEPDCYTVVPPPKSIGDLGTTLSVTIRDVASFAPDAPTVRTEPRIWGLLKAHTNVIAGASGHVRSGTLLGQSAEVNFIPLGFTFDYGDGGTGSSAGGGSTWASLGVPEFSKTATSHRYTDAGEKTITAAVEYAAEYRLGGGEWLPVDGTLSVPADTSHTITVLRNSTVGVDKPCTPGKRAVGC
ncbi:MAG TPA: hypothetical protein VNJ54_10910 [Plantibacter sp.]|uniref:hypothetical protein n=1 Tax=unclassified Plantibacter TaxID=2624265 RepID=UPI002BDAA626|nr:hypothetical protein [Plantibacter sp.]